VASSKVEYEPLGVVLVLSAWNYPILTALPPVAAAICAGNSVILKPSELAPYSSRVLAKLFEEYMDPSNLDLT
jgi:aldehyde dehydrogenase (NAD+)